MWCIAGAKKGLCASSLLWIYHVHRLARGFPLFTEILFVSVFLFSKGCKRELKIWRVLPGEPFCLDLHTKKKLSRQRCEHTDPVMLNLTATRRQIPDTSDDNFTTGFLPSLHRQDRLTFTARFWLKLTWVRTGPRGKTTEWGPSRSDRPWLCLMLVRHGHRCTDQPQPDLFVRGCV